METKRIIELLEIEHECMLKGSHGDCDRKCEDCELVQDDWELHEMYTDAIALLKEQPEIVRCKDCRQAVLTTIGEVKYCKYWQGDEDGTYGGDPLYLDSDFYCAAGERR